MFIFTTEVTMKEYNNKKWWIDSDIVPRMRIKADNLKAALKEYQQRVYDKAYITISDSALKNKSGMYVDTAEGAKQIGYIITGSSDFQDEENYRWSKQYIDLWVKIDTVVDTEF